VLCSPFERILPEGRPAFYVCLGDISSTFSPSQHYFCLIFFSLFLPICRLRVQYTGPGGKPFYFNEETGFFQWERPVGVGSFAEGDPPPGSGPSDPATDGGGASAAGGGLSPGGGNAEEEYGDEAWAYTDADATGAGGGGHGENVEGGYEWQGGGGDGGPAEPIGPWAQYPDEEGYYYWYNHDTGASSWETPNADGSTTAANNQEVTYDQVDYWDPNETYEGGYWDEQGEWVDSTGEEGYYEGYYDETAEWVQYEED